MSHYETNSESDNEYTGLNNIQDLSTDSENNDNTLQNTITGGENDIIIMKKLANMCVKYENDLVKINAAKKNITEKLNKAKKALIPFMEKKEVDFININEQSGGGKLKYNKTKTYKSLTKKNLINLFDAYFGDKQKTEDLVKFLYSNREYKEVRKITKTKK
tara:strand:+ start:181 stop:663 length:483 start_codon:yes stop_codon:yes gene_type:complete